MQAPRLLFRLLKQSLAAQLTLIVAISGLIYLLAFSLPFLLPIYYNTVPPVDYTKLTGYSASGFISYVSSLTALFGLYIYSLKLLKPGPLRLRDFCCTVGSPRPILYPDSYLYGR